MSQSANPESNPDCWRWPWKFQHIWVLILQLIKRGVNPGSVQFSLSGSGAGITCLSKRIKIQTSLWQPHTHPHHGKVRRRRPVNPNTTISHSWTPVSSWAEVLIWIKVFWRCEILLIDSEILLGTMSTCLTSIVQNLLQFKCLGFGFFFNRVANCSHKWCCVTVSYIYIRCVLPVRADCVFCTMVRKKLLS